MTPNDSVNSTLNALELWEKEKNSQWKIASSRCNVNIIRKKSSDDASKAADIAEWFVEEKVVGLLGIAGPESSSSAISAGEVTDNDETPMIVTTDTYPNVFTMRPRSKTQASVLAELGAYLYDSKTASILFQDDLAYSVDFASAFKDHWERIHGSGSVLSYVSFNTQNVNAIDYVGQSSDITVSNADILFMPIIASQIPDIANAVRDSGFKNPILGGDEWGSVDALQKCGEACKDAFFTPLFVQDMPEAQRFVQKYIESFGVPPDDKAALAYDALNVIEVALKDYGKWQGDVFKNRGGLQDALANVKNYKGSAGELTFGNTRSSECVNIARVNAAFHPSYMFRFCPN
jgi:branched-chain amino acid transport system substrate-binding protein